MNPKQALPQGPVLASSPECCNPRKSCPQDPPDLTTTSKVAQQKQLKGKQEREPFSGLALLYEAEVIMGPEPLGGC